MRVTSTVLRWSRRFSTSARVRASNTRHPPAGTSSLITVTKKIEEEDFDWYSPMARQLKGQIDDLPTELLERTLEKLEIQVLVACRQVSPRVKRVIDESVVLQYKIELETAGMEDGPPSEITIAERLQRLRKYTDSWASAQFGSVEKLRGGRGSMLRLSGNVLCRCFGPSNLVLNILPGNLRGVKAKEWRLDDLGFVIEDYAIDAAQDLLVIISRTAEEDRSSSAHMIHCLSLSTGQAHPHAARPKILFPDNLVYDIYEWFKLRLSGDFIGVMVPYSLNADEFQEHLVVWSWKEGTACMWLSEASRIEDFTFVNGFLLTGIEPSMGEKPRLHAYSIDKCSAYTEPVPFTKLSCFTFEYPSYDDHILIMEFSTISSLGSLPELEGSALFRAAPTDVYLAVQMCFESDDFDAEHNFRVTHVVPVSVLTSRIRQMLGQSAPVIPWEEWAPR
ncbi:hypothetical protein GLOTRDRAFT_126203 [Gloeophyllum trabeum ATCC 11539]|uniref:F-box domain-containing protein n=1 Tax=Gloeophyllum trabeum (strain ATCC 11539 / FP-39264 / Madison 617) TaxID=670483 RepID=S7QE75_GLOTA|nr:uncharacterized protein GLOTRDRAFT_126203 [Gloeophyllum trabeum ATCC 11539]EPQ57712.1 hypothetical protein GLOTRDRAFT_126203 [Gloeophyllum trabeum ATCC 11539]